MFWGEPKRQQCILALFKTQLGEAFLEILIFTSSFFHLFSAQSALKAPKPALKRQNRHLSIQTGTEKRKINQKDKNRHLSAETGT